ncbi:MAG TPA: LysR substrate-binding domain-containing protein, partial [Polyangia bacterium]|nr:LysR substrate-binding domain-containing protein [Polyangia bacterium]
QSLQIRKLGVITAGLYASPAYLKKRGEPRSADELAGHDLIDDEESAYSLSRFMHGLARGGRVVVRSDSTHAQCAAAVDGVGITTLYRYLGDAQRGLVRVLPKQELTHDVWLAVHRDLQYAARVRALIDFLVELTTREAALLTGTK